MRDVESDSILERQIRVAVEADDTLVVEADEQLLTAALGNLLQNAIKCSRGGALVALRARREPGAIVVEVEDECGGLKTGAPDALFRPFVRQSNSHSGLGLGLAITRRAVDALSAEIAVRDLPGKGCVFSLRLRPAPSEQRGMGAVHATPARDTRS